VVWIKTWALRHRNLFLLSFERRLSKIEFCWGLFWTSWRVDSVIWREVSCLKELCGWKCLLGCFYFKLIHFSPHNSRCGWEGTRIWEMIVKILEFEGKREIKKNFNRRVRNKVRKRSVNLQLFLKKWRKLKKNGERRIINNIKIRNSQI